MRPSLVLAFTAAVFSVSLAAFAGPPALELARAVAAAYYSPLTVAEIQKAESAPLSRDEVSARFTQSIGTTAVPLFDDDLAAAYRVNTVVQSLRILNRNGFNTLCVWFKELEESDCEDECLATPLTCSGAADDGEPIPPGGVLTLPVTGALTCACGVASGSGTTTTASRIVRDREKP